MNIQETLLKAKLSRAEQEIKSLRQQLEQQEILCAAHSKAIPLLERLINLTSPLASDIDSLQIDATEVLEEIENTI